VRESRTPGSVRGVLSNGHSYRVNRSEREVERSLSGTRSQRPSERNPCAALISKPFEAITAAAVELRESPAADPHVPFVSK